MIKMGFHRVAIYPSSGITLDLRGRLLFQGPADIGNASFLSTGRDALVTFGRNFTATASLRLVSYFEISFGDDCLVGWNALFMDTDMHRLTNDRESSPCPYGKIDIGRNNWFALGCTVMKGTSTSPFTTIAAHTLLSGSYLHLSPKSVIGNKRTASVLAENTWRNLADDAVCYKKDGLFLSSAGDPNVR